jgi:type VI protein secretion system component VasA
VPIRTSVEAFSFLAARVQLKLDDTRSLQHLLEMVYPQYLAGPVVCDRGAVPALSRAASGRRARRARHSSAEPMAGEQTTIFRTSGRDAVAAR